VSDPRLFALAPDPHRLPRTAVPSHYQIRLRPDLEAASFTGEVLVDFTLSEPTSALVLNAIELEIHQCEIDGNAASHQLDEASERLFIRADSDRADSALAAGPHQVRITFTGILNDRLRGFYRSTYKDADGNERVIATTQMQSTDCRRAFPCWDEPDFKATFAVTLEIETGLLAVSNSPEIASDRIRVEDGKELTAITFDTTMVMSTYLVAFVVGPLEATEPIDVDGIPMRIIHVPGKGHLTGFGADVGAYCLKWFQDYYKIPYPGQKVDLLALPDFAAGAMENLGCITFRENLLLVDPTTATQNERQLVADVVAHELAHMWFGDLVTMSWWNGIWLNEAFATFMELAACDAYRPDWGRWTTFGLERSVAFEVDALSSTRPVEFEVQSPADCEGMFDVLTYQKGGALLRMLEQYLGVEEFRTGVNHYLTVHSYANTETADLWDALEATSGAPVREMMDSWIWQPGFPLIHAHRDGAVLHLSQTRFGYSPEVRNDPTTWVVPLAVRNGDNEIKVLLNAGSTTINLTDPELPVIVNAGGNGFYRVAYSEELRSRLRGPVLQQLSTLERYNLVDDAWNSLLAGDLSAIELLEFLEGFGEETDPAVWQAILIAMRGITRLIDDDDARLEKLRLRIITLIQPRLTQLGDPTEGEGELHSKLRGLLVGALGGLAAEPSTIARCREIFSRAGAEPGSEDPELLAAATSVVATHGQVDDYETMLAAFTAARTPQEQLRHLYALSEFGQADLLQRTCELAMSSEVKTQNAPFLLRMCIANRRHGALAWEFLTDHWTEAVAKFPSNTIVRMVDSVKLLTQPDQVRQVAEFFQANPIPQAALTLRQILERQAVNSALVAREVDRFPAALNWEDHGEA
jgi:puromycin-sensitive aminopeptidase